MKLSALLLLSLCVGLSNVALVAQEKRTPALTPAGPHRPASVPADYVVTPFGYFHPSCVLQLARGEHLDNRGVLFHADGSQTQIAACQYSRFSASGATVVSGDGGNKTAVEPSPGPAVQPIINGWIENSNTTTTAPYGKEVSTWIVPPVPLAHDGQTIYFFPGFEDLGDAQTSILQPVMGSTNGGQWTIASWNCCLAGVTDQSTPVNINPGDTIVGTSVMTCAAGTTNCATWNVITQDQTTNQSTELSATPSDGQTFNWGFGGVLEAYSVYQCLDFPPNASLTITSLLYDSNLNLVSVPNWSGPGASYSTNEPQCDYGVTVTATQTTLTYGAAGPAFYLEVAPAVGIAVNQGSSASGTITITDVNGFTGAANVTASNLPPGITAQVTQGASSNVYTLTLTAASTAALTGTNKPVTMTLTASGSGVSTVNTPVSVIVNPPLTGGIGTSVNLAGAYNVYGFFSDSVGWPALNSTDSLDNGGDAYSANQLNPPGFTPMSLNAYGVQFSLGTPNQSNTVYGTGSNPITLPAVQAAQLLLLATGVNGAQKSQNIVVTYSDNTTQTFTQTFDDWSGSSSCTASNPCAAGESVALTMPYNDDQYANPRNDSIFYLYAYPFTLNSSKTVKSLMLPNNRNVVTLAATLLPLSTPAVTVTPPSTTISTSQALSLTVTVSGASGLTTPTGTVILAGGGYTSAAATLSSGSAVISIPAGTLSLGSHTLTASYSGDNNYSAATGVASVTVATPVVTVAPTGLSFAAQNVGSTSAAQTVTLTNSSAVAATITSISASSNFAATNTCGSSLAAGGNCTASVTSTPTVAGSLTGTLTITDNASGSPQTVSLTGTGSSVTVSSASTSLTISAPGGGATDTIQVAPSGGFAGAVNLTCMISFAGTGSAAEAPTCSLNPAQVQIASSSSGSSTLTISTTAATALLRRTNPFLPLGGSAFAAALFFLGVPRRRRWHGWSLLVLLGTMIAGACIGCGNSGSVSNNPPSNPGTTAGNYNVTVTATSGTVTSSVSIPLTVQ